MPKGWICVNKSNDKEMILVKKGYERLFDHSGDQINPIFVNYSQNNQYECYDFLSRQRMGVNVDAVYDELFNSDPFLMDLVNLKGQDLNKRTEVKNLVKSEYNNDASRRPTNTTVADVKMKEIYLVKNGKILFLSVPNESTLESSPSAELRKAMAVPN